MNLFKLTKMLKNEEKIIKYLTKKEVISEGKKCHKAIKSMTINYKEKLYICNKKSCRNKKSIFAHAFFERYKVDLKKILVLCYLYLHKVPVEGIKGINVLSSATVAEWLSL